MNMMDEVTYAIMRAFFSRPVELQVFNVSPADNEDLARAAIEAMREPTEEMKEIGSIVRCNGQPIGSPQDWNNDSDCAGIWRSMIDTALKQDE